MIEIVFGDSACGGLKMAQHYGEGEYQSGAVYFISSSDDIPPAEEEMQNICFISRSDDSRPTEEEIQTIKREYDERERAAWEKGSPMGGNSADVYGFAYNLSMGDISEEIPGEKRRQALDFQYSIYPNAEEEPFTAEMIQRDEKTVREIFSRISRGEEARIWYSSQPDELCGLYWFASQIDKLELREGQIYLVELPSWEENEDGEIVTYSGWGEMGTGEWKKHLALQKTAPRNFIGMCAGHWEKLRQENAPLRAVLNGRLVSMPEDLYDDIIRREIDAEEEEFHEAMLIGRVLGQYALGIGDTVIALRIEKMIAGGKLIPATEAPPDSPIYHRRLRKAFVNA